MVKKDDPRHRDKIFSLPDPRPSEPERTAVVAVDLEEWAEAREALARLETRLEASREDVRRAVEYARGLEVECDRLAEESNQIRRRIGELRSEVDAERGRREELTEQYHFVLQELEKNAGISARYHVERGRREEAEERLEEVQAEVRRLQDKLQEIGRALEEARQRGFKAELGPLTVEVKR